MSEKLKYDAGELVLCFHGALPYDAKILKAEMWDKEDGDEENGPHYLIHYQGWKKTWDEWVTEERMMKHTPENVKKAEELKKSNKKNKNEGKTETKKEKETKDPIATERVETYSRRQDIKIPIPDTLKLQLVDDWQLVTQHSKVVDVPKTPSVRQILDAYRELAKDEKDPEVLDEVVAGLKMYFNRSMGTTLLYRLERPQYLRVCKKNPGKELMDLYGAEHLLRLFVQLPAMIAQTSMDKDSVLILKERLQDILKYMAIHKSQLFGNYVTSAPEDLAQMK